MACAAGFVCALWLIEVHCVSIGDRSKVYSWSSDFPHLVGHVGSHHHWPQG